MQISRYGNNNSPILDSLIEQVSKKAAKQQDKSFEKIANEVLSQKKPSLKEILAQLEDLGIEPSGIDEVPGGLDSELPTDGVGDMEGMKQKIVDLLELACGGPEEAQACVAELGGGGVGEEGMLGDEGMPGVDPIDAEIPGEKDMAMNAPTEAQPAEIPAPAPAPIQAPSQDMPALY